MSDMPDKIFVENSKHSGRTGSERFFNASTAQDDDVYTAPFIRGDLAMQWVPVAEADLQDGEFLEIWCPVRGAEERVFARHQEGKFYSSGGIERFPSHILRIKGPHHD